MSRRVAVVIAFLAGAASVVAALVTVRVLEPEPDVPGEHVARVPQLLTADAPAERTAAVYDGLGGWIDAFDFDPAYRAADAPAAIELDDLDEMAAAGVQTVYVQAARLDERSPEGLVDRAMLGQILVRAHQLGLRVVGWYLPRFGDLDADLARLEAVREFDVLGHRFDGVAVDIEYTRDVPDHVERSRRLVELSERFRATTGDEALGAIVFPPVQLEVVNPSLWPQFPWRALRDSYDVWLPMSYWTFRSEESGYNDGFAYNEESTRRLRRNLGDDTARVHGIGGIGDEATGDDLREFARSIDETRAVGGSIYDWATLDDAKRTLLADLFA
jgi:hypothetical protein